MSYNCPEARWLLSGTFVVAVNGQAALREGKLVMLLILCVGGKITGIPFSLLQILSLLTGPIRAYYCSCGNFNAHSNSIMTRYKIKHLTCCGNKFFTCADIFFQDKTRKIRNIKK